MRTLTIALVALGAAAVTAPAAAQYYPNQRDGSGYGDNDRRGYDQGYNQNSLQQLNWRIERGIRNGMISNREAYSLRRELNQIYALDRRFRQDGLTRWERSELDRRADALRRRVRWERNDADWRNNDRYDRGGWSDRNQNDERYRDRRRDDD